MTPREAWIERMSCPLDVRIREHGRVLVLGEDAWLADRLDRPFEDPGELAALASYFP